MQFFESPASLLIVSPKCGGSTLHRLSRDTRQLTFVGAPDPARWADLVSSSRLKPVLIGRNPYERFVSGYYNKFCNPYWTENEILYTYLRGDATIPSTEQSMIKAYCRENRNIIQSLKDDLQREYRFPAFRDFVIIAQRLLDADALNEHYTPILYEMEKHGIPTNSLELVRLEDLDDFLEGQHVTVRRSVNVTTYNEDSDLSEAQRDSIRRSPGEVLAQRRRQYPYWQLFTDSDVQQINSMFSLDFSTFQYQNVGDARSLKPTAHE